ncbi:MAG: M14 metallopeptidase family protein [Bacteroidota bacterium]
MKRLCWLTLFSLWSALGQEIQSPSTFLGYPLGTQFTRHHRIVDYFEYLAREASDQILLTEYGETYEGRPLLIVSVSSAKNMATLETIRREHLTGTRGESQAKKAIVWLSYNVHGNESVGSEAAMRTLYELLTSRASYLEDTVVIIDPCINPDGRERYVSWYGQYGNHPHTLDPNSREHHEGWLSGRGNHYMLDLNRDWAWLTQKESQQRIQVFNQWLPHVHVDFHEQGVDTPYYFAPAAEPYHEVITHFQRSFQGEIGKNHTKYFDAKGWLYFTKEVFDLLYPSYGDTYPTYNGSVGMTYEQAGSGGAGLGVLTKIGDTLTLRDRLAHHTVTGLSTVEIASKNAQKLNTEFQKFFQDRDFDYASYVLNGNPDKLKSLKRLLGQHQIEYQLGKDGTAKGYDYNTGKQGTVKVTENSMIIHTDQPKGTLVKVLLEPNTKLNDSLTYDITAWSLPYAYGLDAVASTSKVNSRSDPDSYISPSKGANISEDYYANVMDWNSMRDARFLADLLKAKIRVRFAQKPFKINNREYAQGSLIITRRDNAKLTSFYPKLEEICFAHNITLGIAKTGLMEDGKDLGSATVQMVTPPKVAILSGTPSKSLRFGELWHFFERQLRYPVTVIHDAYFDEVNLWKYNTLILPGGPGYKKWLNNDRLTMLNRWIKDGGKLIAMGESIKGISGKKGFGITEKTVKKDSSGHLGTFDQTRREHIKEEITGAIFKAKVDNTHPLAFGYGDTYFTLKLGKERYNYLESGTVSYLSEGPQKPVAGFAGSEAQKKIGKTLIFGVEKLGKGKIVYMVDNPLFRGFWENGKLFMVNALFMVH